MVLFQDKDRRREMGKKTVVIFCRNFDSHKDPFNTPYYWNAYLDLLLAIKEQGGEAYFATDNATYLGDGMFSVAYTTTAKMPLEKFKKVKNVHADIVYNKGHFIGQDVAVLNPEFVRSIMADKAETYRHFAHYLPLTIVCANRKELLAAFDTIKDELIVAKKPTGCGGNNVYIGTKEEVLRKLPDDYPMLVQEFMDTSVGIDGVVDGVHDIRVKLGGGKIWGGTLRVPAAGEYRANVARGGSEKLLYPNEIPDEAKKLALVIDSYFANYPRYYAADFANTTKGWKLIELNSKPGLSPADLSPQSKHITEILAKYLLSLCG